MCNADTARDIAGCCLCSISTACYEDYGDSGGARGVRPASFSLQPFSLTHTQVVAWNNLRSPPLTPIPWVVGTIRFTRSLFALVLVYVAMASSMVVILMVQRYDDPHTGRPNYYLTGANASRRRGQYPLTRPCLRWWLLQILYTRCSVNF